MRVLQRALYSVERARLREQETATETFEIVLPIPGKQACLRPCP